MRIVPPQHELVNLPSYDIPYEAMSKADLIELARVQRAQLQAIYTTIGTSNKVLSPMGKLVHIAADVVMSKQQPNEQGLKRLDMEGAAALIGMSSSAVSRTVRNDCTRFGATYEVKSYITKKGQKCKLSYVNSDDPYWKAPQVVDLPPEQLRNLPGDDRRCSCGGAMRKRTRVLVSQETWICQDCGEQTVYPAVQENLPLDVTQSEAEEEPTEKGLQVVEPFGEEASKSADIPNPITKTPRLAIGEYPLGDFSLEESLHKRIGHGPVIYSTGILDQSRKYLHKPAGYTPNIAAYIRGDLQHIYGSRPAFPDGTTYLLGFDGDTPELDAHRLEWMAQLAAAGIPSICWLRRPGRWHLETYTDKAVDSRAFYAYVTEACPGLLAVPEVFPIDAPGGVDRSDFPYSWPLYYRIGNQAIECAAEVMLAGDTAPMVSLGIQSDRKRLEWLISQAIIPAERIPALPLIEEETRNAASQGVALLDIPSPVRSVPFDDGLGRLLIANWNAGHTWEEIAEVRDGRICATWRPGADGKMGERTPSVFINDDGSAHDYGAKNGYPKHFDKFEAYCLINALDKGEQVKRLIAAFQAMERVEVAS